MKRKTFILFFTIFFIATLFAGTNEITDKLFTTLVIIEECQNGDLSKESLVSDGIFDALWNKSDKIFFDMVIEKPFVMNKNEIDPSPFLKDAFNTGADSIILIKFNYTISEEKNGLLKITLDSFNYNVFSLTQAKPIIAGEKKLSYNELIEKNNKEKILRELGTKIIDSILK